MNNGRTPSNGDVDSIVDWDHEVEITSRSGSPIGRPEGFNHIALPTIGKPGATLARGSSWGAHF